MKIYKLTYYDKFDTFYKQKFLLGYFSSEKLAYEHFLVLKKKDDNHYKKVLPTNIDRLRYEIKEIIVITENES